MLKFNLIIKNFTDVRCLINDKDLELIDLLREHIDTKDLFETAFAKGQLKAAQKIWQCNPYVSDYILQLPCICGHINIAKWIYEVSDDAKIFYTKNADPFMLSCVCGHLDMMQWIYSLENKYLDEESIKSSFKWSCGCGYLNIAKWLYSLNDNLIELCYDDIFKLISRYGYSEIEEWIYETNKLKSV